MDRSQIQAYYNIEKKCDFAYSKLPNLEDVWFSGVRFPVKGLFRILDNGVITYSATASRPVLFLQNNEKKRLIPIRFSTEWIEFQFPNSHFEKMYLEPLEELEFGGYNAYLRKNFSSFSFEKLQRVKSFNKYSVKFEGTERYVERKWKEVDHVYEMDIYLDVDVAFGLDLENGKTVLFTYSDGGELNTVYIGTKAQLKALGAFSEDWIVYKERIEYVEERIR